MSLISPFSLEDLGCSYNWRIYAKQPCRIARGYPRAPHIGSYFQMLKRGTNSLFVLYISPLPWGRCSRSSFKTMILYIFINREVRFSDMEWFYFLEHFYIHSKIERYRDFSYTTCFLIYIVSLIINICYNQWTYIDTL